MIGTQEEDEEEDEEEGGEDVVVTACGRSFGFNPSLNSNRGRYPSHFLWVFKQLLHCGFVSSHFIRLKHFGKINIRVNFFETN